VGSAGQHTSSVSDARAVFRLATSTSILRILGFRLAAAAVAAVAAVAARTSALP